MEDLTGNYTQSLVPSSMCAGNTTADDRQYSMSAPGSPSVLPVADKLDHLPLPEYSGSQVPVGHPGRQKHTEPASSAHGGGTFDTITISGEWKEVS